MLPVDADETVKMRASPMSNPVQGVLEEGAYIVHCLNYNNSFVQVVPKQNLSRSNPNDNACVDNLRKKGT